MKRNIFILSIVVSILIVFSALVFASDTINVKDYIKDKFPPAISLHLSSLGSLDSYEKEFVDLLEKLPEEEQECYAKLVYQYGFHREILEIAKEGKPIAVYVEAYDKALILVEKREYKNALPYLEIAVKTDVLSLKAEVYHGIGICYGKLKSYEKALEAYKQVILIKPNHVFAHGNLGVIYHKLGFDEDAIEEYKQAIRIDPGNTKYYCNLGVSYYSLGFYEDAAKAYKQAIRIDPDNLIVYSNLGAAYFDLGLYEDAIDILKQAVNVDPDNAISRYNLGAVFYNLGFNEDAIEEYKQAIRIEPDKSSAHSGLGFAYHKIGDKNSALNEYKILKKLNINLANELLDFINK